jgi:serine/threonine protein kinase
LAAVTQIPPASTGLQPGALFHGRYRIVRRLKAGAMGAVYEVVDDNTAASRALKVMLPSLLADAEQRGRFALEARVTGTIESDHLVRVADSGTDEATGSPFLVMELLRGEDLGDLVARRGPLPPAEVATYLGQASLALDKTHAAGVVHRDLKPPNLFLTRRDDGSPCVKILDFGIAKVVAQNQAKTRALGTPLYMAPEQFSGEGSISIRTDLYALAHVAYTLLAGEPYWLEESKADDSFYELLMKIMAGATEPPSVRAARRKGVLLPKAFDAWFFKATLPAAQGRFDQASAQTAALVDVIANPVALAVTALPPPAPPAAPIAIAPAATASTGALATSSMGAVGSPSTSGAFVTPFTAAPAPEPLAPPVPPAPMVPAAPAPRPRRLLVAMVVIAAVMAVGLVLVGLSLLNRGDGGSGNGSGTVAAQMSGCPPRAVCVSMDIPDPAHVDPVTIFPAVEKLVKGADPRAVFTLIVGETSRDGTSDLSGDHSLLFQFGSAAGMSAVTVRGKNAILMKGNPFPSIVAIPAPDAHCNARAAWKAAVAGGLVPAPGIAVMYSMDSGSTTPTWGFTTAKSRHVVDARTCALKSANKY